MKNDKKLVIVLVVLLVVIVGLVTGVIIVNLNQNNNDGGVENSEDYSSETIPAEDEAILANLSAVNEQAKQILETEPVDINYLVMLYDDIIAFAREKNRTGFIMRIVLDRNEALLSKDYKREALDALKSVEYDVFSEPDQYRLFDMIIEQAKELGDEGTVETYTELQEGVADAYWADVHATEEALKEWESEQKENVQNNDGESQDQVEVEGQ